MCVRAYVFIFVFHCVSRWCIFLCVCVSVVCVCVWVCVCVCLCICLLVFVLMSFFCLCLCVCWEGRDNASAALAKKITRQDTPLPMHTSIDLPAPIQLTAVTGPIFAKLVWACKKDSGFDCSTQNQYKPSNLPTVKPFKRP